MANVEIAEHSTDNSASIYRREKILWEIIQK